MSSRIGLLAASSLAFLGLLASAGTAQEGATTVVSVSSDGNWAQVGAWRTAISPDGRWVAFETHSTDLDPAATTLVNRVYLHDRVTGQLELISVTPGGLGATKNAGVASVSEDGLFVAFAGGDELAPGDSNGKTDILVRDRAAGTTELVSVSSDEVQANADSLDSSISADGRYVAFDSAADNLVAGDGNGKTDVFLRDRLTGQTTRLSVATGGGEANGHSSNPALSLDGQHVAFESNATNLDPFAANGATHIYVHDVATGVTERVSIALDGGPLLLQAANPGLSADGRIVSFDSWSNNLVVGDTNATNDVFAHDRDTGATTRVSVSSTGAQANDYSGMIFNSDGADEHTISADGRFVVYSSEATNLVPGDSNVREDLFVHDRDTGLTTRASLDSQFGQGDGHSLNPSMSADGRWIAFESHANDLVDDDQTPTGSLPDAFLRDRGPWNDLGSALDGFAGPPALYAAGWLEAGTPFALALRQAAPQAPAVFFVALNGTPVPFKGGTLQAFPPLLTLSAMTATNGQILLSGTWPAGIPAGTDLHFQWAIGDFGAPWGVALSQALEAITP
jgi:Tol biopolymer transport system component